jgi:hypothetical protein
MKLGAWYVERTVRIEASVGPSALGGAPGRAAAAAERNRFTAGDVAEAVRSTRTASGEMAR